MCKLPLLVYWCDFVFIYILLSKLYDPLSFEIIRSRDFLYATTFSEEGLSPPDKRLNQILYIR